MAGQYSESARRTPIRARGLERLLSGDVTLAWGLLFSAWAIVFLAAIGGDGRCLYYDPLTEHPSWAIGLSLVTFVAGWLIMAAAMMLPASLPLIQLFARVMREQNVRLWQPLVLLFVAAYLVVWSLFALVTFIGDFGLHRIVESQPWLNQHSSWFAGVALLVAGGFQFSELKEQCLRVCRHPFAFLTQYYGRGAKATWDLGVRHGLHCLGCCWALMLVMFAVGVVHLTGMLVLTAVMAIEKTSTWGRPLVPLVGTALLVWGGWTLLWPDTATTIFTSSRCLSR